MVCFVAVQRDVTRDIALENQLRHAQKLEIVWRLASGVADDLNNTLTVVRGNAEELLKETGHSPDAHEALSEILEPANRAAKLTRQLLVFNRKEAISSPFSVGTTLIAT